MTCIVLIKNWIKNRLERQKGVTQCARYWSEANYTGLSIRTLYTTVIQRRIPHVKVGRLVKFDPQLLDGLSRIRLCRCRHDALNRLRGSQEKARAIRPLP